MADKTGIEWTESTWNPIRGCSRVSAGCMNCYAESQAARIQRCDRGRGIPEGKGSYDGLLAKGGQWNGKVRVVDHLLDQPLRWRRSRRIFVNSMSDLFHESISDDVIDRVFGCMVLAHWHTFQVLTKRPERMRDYLMRDRREKWARAAVWFFGGNDPDGVSDTVLHADWPPRNIWLGVSVEDQATADERIPLLLQTPAHIRWLSMEPLLGPVDLERIEGPRGFHASAFGGHHDDNYYEFDNGIDWVVVGGESGPGARPMHPDWARSIRDQCRAAGVPFLFKQWGEWVPRGPMTWGYPIVEGVDRIRLTDTGENGQDLGAGGDNDVWVQKAGKKRAGRWLDGRHYDQYPEVAHG